MASGQEFDILVIGGGATGCGVALDAVSRGTSEGLFKPLHHSSCGCAGVTV